MRPPRCDGLVSVHNKLCKTVGVQQNSKYRYSFARLLVSLKRCCYRTLVICRFDNLRMFSIFSSAVIEERPSHDGPAFVC